MKLIIPVLLGAVLLISGCTAIGGPGGIFGADVIKVNTRVVEEAGRDPIVIRDIMTIPTSPVLPDQQVYFSFVLENVNKVHTVPNVRADLFNAPGFRNANGQLCNSGIDVCLPDAAPGEAPQCTNANPCTILPGEQRLIQYTLIAPSKTQIANIKTQARLDFKVLYDFESDMNFVIPAINKEEVIRRQREGEQLDIKFEKSFSAGPVRIDVQPLGVNYILDDLETILLFDVKNVGNGNLLKSEISPVMLINSPSRSLIRAQSGAVIMFPPELTVSQPGGDPVTLIFGQPMVTPDGQTYSNKKAIQMYRDKTQTSMRFPVKLKDFRVLRDNQIPFRSYEIKSKVFYTYELRSNVDIVVNPFENI